MHKLIINIFMVILSVPVWAMPHLPKDIKQEFGEFSGCFLIKDLSSNELKVYNKSQCRVAWTPNSTFKILNSLIGLESRVIKDKNMVIKWNGKKQYLKAWEKDHTLESAIKASAVPYYQELSRRVGKERMQAYVKKVNYGNSNIGDVVDRFWLDGPLKITAYEQLDFIERLYKNQLPFSKDNMKTVKEIIVKSTVDGRIFSGKTGSSYDGKNIIWGWFVGHVKNKGKEYVFVANIKGPKETWGRTAMKISDKILMKMGI